MTHYTHIDGAQALHTKRSKTMNPMIAKLNKMTANQVFEVVAGLMSNLSSEAEIVIELAMDVLESKVGEAEFCRLMEQFA